MQSTDDSKIADLALDGQAQSNIHIIRQVSNVSDGIIKKGIYHTNTITSCIHQHFNTVQQHHR